MTDYVWHDENYDKRIQLTIDSSKVSSDLTDFPVLIHLSNLSGITSADVTSVFDELTVTSGIIYTNTYNPSDKDADYTLSNGDLTANSTSNGWKSVRCVYGQTTGKWYWEVRYDVAGSTNPTVFGFGDSSAVITGQVGDNVHGWAYKNNGKKRHSASDLAYGASWTAGDVIGCALDLDNHKVWWSKNGVWQASGDPAAGTSPAYSSIPASVKYFGMDTAYDNGSKHTVRYAEGDLTYIAPVGFTAGFYDTVMVVTPNNKKIAVYTTSGTQDVQCYTEIEKWVATSGSEEAWLWVKAPTVSGSSDTHLYLYYDKTVSDNTSYIGDVGDYAAKQVWDSNFNAVFHFSENSYTGAASEVENSTGGEDGHALNSAQLSSALIGNGLDVDNINKGAITENNINPGNVYTAEYFFLKPWGTASTNAVFRSVISNHYYVLIDSGNLLSVYNGAWRKSTYNLDTNTSNGWHHLAAISNDINTYFYVDGAYVASVGYHCTAGFDYFGGYPGQAWGDIDEVRVSNVNRSAAWVKATYNTGIDNLITFGSEEGKPSFIFNGYVQVQGVSAARVVNLYHRSTGSLVGTAVSNGSTGYFEIPTPFNDYHFVNVLPELSEDYNILVEDKIEQGS